MQLSPPQKFIKIPLEVGAKWKYADEVFVSDYEVNGEEEITVPAGTFKAIKITMNGLEYSGPMSFQYYSILWVSKGVGIVKEDSKAGMRYPFVAKLVSKELK